MRGRGREGEGERGGGGREGQSNSELFSSLSTVQPHILLLDYLLLFGSKSCVFEDLRLFLDSFPDEEVDEALQTFEQMVADDPVDFDCEDIDIRENVSVLLVYEVWCTV